MKFVVKVFCLLFFIVMLASCGICSTSGCNDTIDQAAAGIFTKSECLNLRYHSAANSGCTLTYIGWGF